ncbi:hypothetical protein MUY14_34275 [Amycolatopsis sp. FBCC-B4732]|uniref:hypothetical protein n=1 Tax=Amycolatopsis sp. FBCC-B4732 TaxID=3079339 RepID=UPI001FF0F8B4|nr:hypothetical protein [Amycolatopsis sp. FBCC-B4732]UOX86776.1 hypothetical protein MUY14_34275 [Amycolatopsis sp. FBCC-B4732]
MTDQTGGDQPQKTVAELLAQHGAQAEGGGRRRRRRAADDDDEPGTPEAAPGVTGSHRRPGVSDTGPQAIIDRVASEGAPPPPPPGRPTGRRRAEPPPPPPPAPRAVPQDSQPLPRPVPPPPARPAPGGAESGQYQRPVPPPESSQYVRPPQESGQFSRPAPPEPPPAAPRPPESAQLPVPPRAPRRQPPPPQPSQQLPVPPPAAEETRGAVPPVRRRPGPPQPSQQLPTPPQPSQQLPASPPPAGPLSARLDGLNGTPDADIDVPPGPMASGTFATPPAAPGRPRRAPSRRPQPQPEAYTEQFSAVPDDEPPSKKGDEPSAPGLANWRKRRQKEQMEDTEIGVMPAVPTDAPGDGYPEDDFEPEGFAPEGSGYQAAYDAGPPTGAYPPPMPFAPGDRASRAPIPDDLEPYEREFADGYPADGPDFEQDDYAYEQGEGYEDDEYDDAPEPAPEPAAVVSPGKAWLALAGQLAMGVVGGAAVWLGFNWLWVNIPAAALVAALLVVVALVWIVRKIRRAEDLQTTVLAVLVGLVVTVSPAALLLVGR